MHIAIVSKIIFFILFSYLTMFLQSTFRYFYLNYETNFNAVCFLVRDYGKTPVDFIKEWRIWCFGSLHLNLLYDVMYVSIQDTFDISLNSPITISTSNITYQNRTFPPDLIYDGISYNPRIGFIIHRLAKSSHWFDCIARYQNINRFSSFSISISRTLSSTSIICIVLRIFSLIHKISLH